eukprot:CAMPEP_0167825664 /NCGR_PEP_ID=MMETSP0112_2-20121227/9517_1 /TAXON_ID=91324 /ORGANISM="Lotharella globosa, Strain CCCM811" /LENGTH=448 /DNA_ID=CAMNT_0007727847 /DNA_START=73 /DNA_END=1419 /DNA_ORIENTATION=+
MVMGMFAQTRCSTDDFPHRVLRSHMLTVTVYTPDAQKGYYRASRFEWSSMIGHVTLDNTSFLDDWRKPHNPEIPEHGIGFAEEFGMANPPGFEPRKGSRFLKLGVGVCENHASAPYDFNYAYRVVDPGQWTWQSTESSMVLKTRKTLGKHGYAFEKRISVENATITIHHILENIGEKPISTWTYSHNFFNRPNSFTGTNYTFNVPVSLTRDSFDACTGDATGILNPTHVSPKAWKSQDARDAPALSSALSPQISSKEFYFSRELNASDVIYCDFGFTSSTPNRFSVRDAHGNGFNKVGTESLQTLHFYAVNTTLAVEPFSHIHLKPGEKTSWTHHVTFIASPESKQVESTLIYMFFQAFVVMTAFLLLGWTCKCIFTAVCKKHRTSERLSDQEVKPVDEQEVNKNGPTEGDAKAEESGKPKNYGSCVPVIEAGGKNTSEPTQECEALP